MIDMDIKQAGLTLFQQHGLHNSVLAVTLTTDPSKYDFYNKSQQYIDDYMKRELRYLHNKLNDKICGNNWQRKHTGVDIYAVREEKHKQPHIHMAVALDEIADVRKASQFINSFWPKTRTGGWSNHIELITDASGWMDYSLKHLSPKGTDAIYACKGVLN